MGVAIGGRCGGVFRRADVVMRCSSGGGGVAVVEYSSVDDEVALVRCDPAGWLAGPETEGEAGFTARAAPAAARRFRLGLVLLPSGGRTFERWREAARRRVAEVPIATSCSMISGTPAGRRLESRACVGNSFAIILDALW